MTLITRFYVRMHLLKITYRFYIIEDASPHAIYLKLYHLFFSPIVDIFRIKRFAVANVSHA